MIATDVGWDDEGYRRWLEELKRAFRLAGVQASETRRMKLIDQLIKFKVCTCVAMGRYSTCCQPRNDK